MRARDALYDFVEALIAADTTGPLTDAESFRSLRRDLNTATKVIRVETIDGYFTSAPEASRKEQGVSWTIQCWVTPADLDETSQDEAVDISFDMTRAIFDSLQEDQTLGGQVCLAYGDHFETTLASFGSTLRAVTYLDGETNPLGQG